MQYTLDSLRHVEQCLIQGNKNYKVYSSPIVLAGEGLKLLTEKEKSVYFGVLTFGENDGILNYRGNKIITVLQNCQIIEMFTDLEFAPEVENPKGLFRGFEIQLQY